MIARFSLFLMSFSLFLGSSAHAEMSSFMKASLNQNQATKLNQGGTQPSTLQKMSALSVANSIYGSDSETSSLPPTFLTPSAPAPAAQPAQPAPTAPDAASAGFMIQIPGSAAPVNTSTTNAPVGLSCAHAKGLLSRFVRILALHVKECGATVQTMSFDYVGSLIQYMTGVLGQYFIIEGCNIDSKEFATIWNSALSATPSSSTSFSLISPVSVPCTLWQNVVRQMTYLMGYLSSVCPKKLDNASLQKHFASIDREMSSVLQKGQCTTNFQDLATVYKAGAGIK